MGCIFGVISDVKIDLKTIKKIMGKSLACRHQDCLKEYRSKEILLVAGGNSADSALVMDPNENYIAACEGEIYNERELSTLLPEVKRSEELCNPFTYVPFLYEKYGYDFPKYLNGVFTIALWDNQKKELHLIRDHVGSHSLFYSSNSGETFFSTTIKSLLASGHIKPTISYSAINQYFSLRALSPPVTMFKNVAAIRAAHVTTVGKRVTEYDYWKLHELDVDEVTSEYDYVEQLRTIIQDAVHIRAQYPGEYGAIVSGGLDTGVVSAVLANKSHRLKTFSVAFEEEAFSDVSLQKIMIDRFRFKHQQAIVSPVEFAELLVAGIGHLDSPVNDVAYAGMSKVFQLASESGCKVVFEGEGPDEIFPAGNTHGEREIRPYLAIPSSIRHKIIGTFFQRMPLGDSIIKKIIRFWVRIGMDDNERRVTWRTYFHNSLRKKLLTFSCYSDACPYDIPKEYLGQTKMADFFNKYQFGLIKSFLPDDLLYKDERMAASHGVINRVPLVDYRLVELALKIPSRYQICAPTSDSDGIKLLYKKALKGLIPNEILYRKKDRGFSHPTSLWYRRQLKDFVFDVLLSKTAKERGFFNMDYVYELLEEHSSGNSNLDFAISSMLIFELWLKEYYD